MDAAPQKILIKRKRGEEAPEALFYEGDAKSAKPVQPKYIFKRLKVESDTVAPASALDPCAPEQIPTASNPVTQPGPRQFHLTRPHVTSRKRRRDGDDLATFVELSHNNASSSTDATVVETTTIQNDTTMLQPTTPLKRPNTRIRKLPSAVQIFSKPTSLPPDTTVAALQLMADQVTATEAAAPPRLLPARTPQPLKYKPIITPRRTQKAAATPSPVRIRVPSLADPEPHKTPTVVGDAMDIDDASEYIIETYIRHAAPADATIPSDAGYLIISKSEEELWESYLEAEMPSSDEEFASDEEDENAEDWHGADYPEDELSEDDELGEGAYKYFAKKRKGSDASLENSDAEEWGFGSDFEGEEESWREKWV